MGDVKVEKVLAGGEESQAEELREEVTVRVKLRKNYVLLGARGRVVRGPAIVNLLASDARDNAHKWEVMPEPGETVDDAVARVSALIGKDVGPSPGARLSSLTVNVDEALKLAQVEVERLKKLRTASAAPAEK